MADFEPVLLRRIGKAERQSLDAYRADGGYRALAKARRRDDAGAGRSTPSRRRACAAAAAPASRAGVKWTFLPKDHPGPIYLCVNADESEPCTFNNRILMEEDPHQVLEGIILACYATRASDGLHLYPLRVRPRLTAPCRRPSTRLYATNLLGKNILGKDFHLDVYHAPRGRGLHLRRGDGADRKPGRQARPGRASSRRSPPSKGRSASRPSSTTSRRWPACTHIVDRGADWFKSMGVPPDPKNPRDAGSYGPKLYCISGHVNKPGCVELPLGVTVRELVDKHGGGVWKGRKAKGCIPGGISMGLMTEAEFDTPLDFNGPGKVGCLGLGTAAVTVFDEDDQHRRRAVQHLPVLRP